MMPFKRLKTLILSLCAAIGLWTPRPALAAGTTPLSLVQQFDSTGAPLIGCQLYFYVAGTVATPQTAFADFGLTTPLPNPLTCDASGRVPQHWLADGLIHIRLTDTSGIAQVDTTMQVLGPSSGGGGGGGTVDPTSILATGDLKVKYGTGPIAGFVRGNGLTIGNAVSGATERANADTQTLFVYLYNTDANLVVSGGRTGNALNDFNANKQLTLPDWRGRAIAALDDMGNSAAGRLTATYWGNSGPCIGALGTTLGQGCGGESQTLTLAQLPTGITSSNASQPISVTSTVVVANGTNGGSVSGGGAIPPYNTVSQVTSTGNNSISVTSNNTSGSAHPNVQPTMLATIYLKL